MLSVISDILVTETITEMQIIDPMETKTMLTFEIEIL